MTGWSDEMALIVVHTSVTPTEYWALTLAERNAILRQLSRSQRRR